MIRVRACGLSDVGLTRSHNEDCFDIDPEHQVYVVADGMGGHSHGEVASRIAVKAIRDFVDPGWPLMYGVSAVARLLFGRELWVELLVVAIAFAIGAGFTLTAAARLSGSIALALMVTLLEIGLNPRSFGYPKLLLYAIAGWAFVAATRSSSRAANASCTAWRAAASRPAW